MLAQARTGAVVAVALALVLVTPALAQIPDIPESIPVDVPFAGVHTIYEKDFEIDDGGWSASVVPPPAARLPPLNPDWEWGEPTSGPGEAHSGSRAWGVALDGAYRTPQCAAIRSPVIDLADADTASVTFQHWVHMDTGSFIAFHGGILMVTTDGGDTLTRVSPQGGYPSVGLGSSARACFDDAPSGQRGYSGGPSADYASGTVNLNAFAGQAIQFLFAFGTDGVSRGFDGWYIDDFAVTIDGETTVEDFEASDGGFTVVGTRAPGDPPRGWEWDDPTTGPDHVGRLWATNPHGHHGHGECHWVESAPIALGPAADGLGDALADQPASVASLSWRQFFRTTAITGQGVVQVGTPDGNYTLLTPEGGYDRTVYSELTGCLGTGVGVYGGERDPAGGEMQLERADLTPWLGQEVTIRFLFASRASGTTQDGWYLDDVKVELGFGASTRIDVPQPPEDPAAPFTPIATLYAEDFETSDGDWVESGTGEWDWGAPAPPPNPPSGSLNLWGTRTAGDYGTNACGWITSPPIALPGAGAEGPATAALLELDLFVDTRDRHDGAVLEVSPDGGETWHYVVPEAGYDAPLFAASGAPALACLGLTVVDGVWTGPAEDADDWRRARVDLTPFLGSDVLLRIGFASNALADGQRGVYLDSAVVSLGAGATLGEPDPSQAGIVPPGWEVTGENPSWLYGVPTTGPLSLRPTWATGLHGPYHANECSAIVSRAIDTTLVPGLGPLELTFQHVFDAATTTHAGVIQVSDDDGETWRTVTPTDGYPNSLGTIPRDCLTPGETGTRGYAGRVTGSYEGVTVSLRDYEGETIRVRFAFASSATIALGDGWYIRDLALTKGAGAVPLAGAGAPGLGAAAAAEFADIADPALVRLVEEGLTGELDVILTGPAHRDVGAQALPTRAAWGAWFDAEAAPFEAAVRATVAAWGGEVLDAWPAAPAVKVRAPVAALPALAALTGAEHMAEDHDERIQLVEPIEGDAVGVLNTNGRRMIEAEEIWDLGYMGEGIRIAIIDTGIDPRHEAFKHADGSSRIVGFANCIGAGECDDTVAAFDDHGHGTHVGATAAGSDLYDDPEFGRFQEVGVAPRADLLGVKFLSGGGSGSLADALDALEWSFDNDADLTSNSWGGACTSGATSVLSLVNSLSEAGMPSVAAAGNSGPSSGTILSPGCAEEAISVGAVDDNEVIASFSSRGPCSDPSRGGPSRTCPDLVAKGVNVRSAIPRDGASAGDPSGYRVWQGTSMATPHVAGAVALAEQFKRAITGHGWDTAAGAEKEILTMTAKPLGSPTPNNNYGWGLPQLTAVYALTNATDHANIISDFEVSADELWLGDAATLGFGVRNLGAAIATGDFRATLTDPLGDETSLHESTVSLGLLDAERFSTEFVVLEDVLPGAYTFAGTFDYTWTDPDGIVHEERVEHEGNFTVYRVFMEFAIDGFPDNATLLDLHRVTATMVNTGNEDGRNVAFEFTVPDAYEFMPAEPLGLLDPNGYYSTPPPDEVHHDDHFGRTTLVYQLGDLGVEETFEVTLNLLTVETGTHWVRAVGKFQDGAGTAGLQSQIAVQDVELV